MTIFGNRDFERSDFVREDEGTNADHGWTHDDALAQLLDPPALPGTESENGQHPSPVDRETRRVVMRIQGADDVELGRVQGREAGVDMAREMIRAIEAAQSRGEWPQVEDRFIRPGAIVSVDVQRAD